MTMDEIKLWVVDGAKAAVEVPEAAQTDSERLLEDTLGANPDLLMPGLTLVGRQTPTEGGPLDLLGVDADGRLVVFELKRGTLSRDAVAQVIDYASSLDAMNDSELAEHISARSDAHGVEKIDDFRAWYESRTGNEDLGQLRPVRMVLVGLGADRSTSRMVRFLAKGGIDISLLTFHGYVHNGKTLLARQVQVESSPRRRPSRSERLEQLESRIRERTEQWADGRTLWDAAREMFRECFSDPLERADGRKEDWAQYRLNLYISRRGPYASIGLDTESLIVIFFKKSVELRLKEFTKLPEGDQFQHLSSSQSEQGCWSHRDSVPGIDTLDEWEQHKKKLGTSVARSVYEAVMGSDAE